MPDYRVFGGVLRSEIEFPELEYSLASTPDWLLRVSDCTTPPPSPHGVLLGNERVDVGVMVQARRSTQGFQLEYDDTGTFDISSDGREIVWWRTSSAAMEAARLDILGRVLAMALHASGRLALHGSAVAINGRAVAFVAPKFSGKSTLAIALSLSGAEFMADDTIPISLGATALAQPGVHAVRLFSDSATWLSLPLATTSQSVDPFAEKYTFATVPASQRRVVAAPLAAIYVLAPQRSAADAAQPCRERLVDMAAACEILRHAKIGSLLGGPEAGSLLGRVASLARSVPAFLLPVPREYDRLPDLVASLLAWHGSRSAAECVALS